MIFYYYDEDTCRYAWREVNMNLKNWNKMQLEEALGPTNRFYFKQTLGYDGSDDELVLYYIEHGGAKHFRDFHKEEEI